MTNVASNGAGLIDLWRNSKYFSSNFTEIINSIGMSPAAWFIVLLYLRVSTDEEIIQPMPKNIKYEISSTLTIWRINLRIKSVNDSHCYQVDIKELAIDIFAL